MNVSPVLELLRQKIGLNPESIGTEALEKSIREQIEISGVASIEDYVKKVNGSAAEWAKLVDAVVVGETSFFRNTTPFVTLQSHLKQFVLNKRRGGALRILCLPCSTGEEAYSIAMVLFDMGLSADKFFLFAGDISEHVMQIAKAGSYSPYSFRGEDVAFREKYFTSQPDGTYLLNKEVRDAVHFEQANILAEHFLFGHKPYDVIFCRNLLIYFDVPTKARAVNALLGHLAEEGVLFVGHAEGASVVPCGLVGLDYPMSFVFARKKYAAVINETLNVNDHGKGSIPPPVSAPSAIQTSVGNEVIKFGLLNEVGNMALTDSAPAWDGNGKIAAKKSLADGDLSKAKQLADAGSSDEAVSICERLLSEGVESAEIYYLLGQAAISSGDNLLAEEYLMKAIYLDADFYDALISLSLICGRMGNPEKGAVMRRRAQRVKARNAGKK